MAQIKQHLVILVFFAGFLLVFSFKLAGPMNKEKSTIAPSDNKVGFETPDVLPSTNLGDATMAPVPLLFVPQESTTFQVSESTQHQESPVNFPRLLTKNIVSGVETLIYPPVARQELNIQSGGVRNRREFVEQFLLAEKDRIQVTKTEYEQLVKNKEGIVLFPVVLIEQALVKNSFPHIRNSLILLKNFFQRQEERLRIFPVAESSVGIAQQILGFNRLTVELIDKTLEYEQGKMSQLQFLSFFNSYKHTHLLFQEEMRGVFSLKKEYRYASHERFRFLLDLFDPILRVPKASAQGILVPFGGLIVANITTGCECTGYIIVVNDAATQRSIRLVLNYVSYALLLGGKDPSVGQSILGLYLPGAGICLSAASECASSSQQDGLIIAPPTGTSIKPSS